MKTVTISVEEQIVKFAKVYAAKQGKSLSAFISEYLRDLMASEDQRHRSYQNFFSRGALFNSQGKRFGREELYDRKILR